MSSATQNIEMEVFEKEVMDLVQKAHDMIEFIEAEQTKIEDATWGKNYKELSEEERYMYSQRRQRLFDLERAIKVAGQGQRPEKVTRW